MSSLIGTKQTIDTKMMTSHLTLFTVSSVSSLVVVQRSHMCKSSFHKILNKEIINLINI